MNNAQVRVIDPILSTVARGYRNAAYVGSKLFPGVPVTVSGGQILTFGKDAFRLFNTARAPGGSTRRVTFGYAGEKYSLGNHSLEGVVPREHQRDAAAVPGINLAQRSVNLTMNSLLLGLEQEQAVLATTPGNYGASNKETLAGSDQWDDPDSDPSQQIGDYRETVRGGIALRPNTVLIGAKAFKALKVHPKILDRIKYTSKDSLTPAILAALWDVQEVIVGDAVVMDASGNVGDVWGNNVVLAYTAMGALGHEEPSFGYTYTMEGNPMVEQPYYDNNAKSWVYPVTHERAPVIAGADAGFLVQSVVSG